MNIEIRQEGKPTEYVKILYERYNKKNSQRLRREQTKEDGGQHYEPDAKLQDEQRTKYLEHIGLKVLRFTNWDINHDLESVCMTIDREVMSRI